MTQLKRCAVPQHPHWYTINGNCHGFAVTTYLQLSHQAPGRSRRLTFDIPTLEMIKQVQAEHAADPTRMPTALTNYDAIQVATAKLTVHPQYSPQVLNLQELKNCINQIERSGKLTIMTLVSRDYPGHTFLIDGRSRMGDLWLYDSHLPALLTRIDSARFEETLYQYTLSKLVQIINYRPDFRDPTSFFLEAVTLEEVSTMAKADR